MMYDLQKGYELAKEYYQEYGVDVDEAIRICDETQYRFIAGRETM